MNSLQRDELKRLVQQSYFRSLVVFNHGGIETPTKLCTIQNPRLRILEFERQGKYIPFNSILTSLTDPDIKKEMNFAMLYGLDRYKTNSDAYIDKTSRQTIMKLFQTYPYMKVYDQKNPPLNLRLSFEEQEYMMDDRGIDAYPLIYKVNISFKKRRGEFFPESDFFPMITIFENFLTSTLKKFTYASSYSDILQEYGYNTDTITYEYVGHQQIEYMKQIFYGLSWEKVGDTYNLQFFIPISPHFSILKNVETNYRDIISEHMQNNSYILKMGSYSDGKTMLPIDSSLYKHHDEHYITLLQKLIDKYQWIYDTMIVISCKEYEGDYAEQEGKGSTETFDVPVDKKGTKRSRYYLI